MDTDRGLSQCQRRVYTYVILHENLDLKQHSPSFLDSKNQWLYNEYEVWVQAERHTRAFSAFCVDIRKLCFYAIPDQKTKENHVKTVHEWRF